MEINFTLDSSLERIVLAKVATLLLNHHDVIQLEKQFENTVTNLSISSVNMFETAISHLKNVENVVVKKVHQLQLNVTLTSNLIAMIHAMLGQVLNYGDGLHELSTIVWTAEGLIDKAGIFRVRVADRSYTILERFEIACEYCLEDQITVLWNQLKGNVRPNVFWYHAVRFWVCNLQGTLEELKNEIETYCLKSNVHPYKFAILFSAVDGNYNATKYYFQKLNTVLEHDLLMLAVRRIVEKGGMYTTHIFRGYRKEHPAVLCFLLSQMDRNQQAAVFKEHSFRLLRFFLDWPWLKFFMGIVSQIRDDIPKEEYFSLLNRICERIHDVDRDYSYRKLLQEFWLHAPTSSQSYALKKMTGTMQLLGNLFNLEDKESIKCILSVATPAEKLDIICNSVWIPCINNGNYETVEFVIRECISSKSEFKEFETRLLGHIQETEHTNVRDRLNSFLKWYNED